MRKAEVNRSTGETQVQLYLDLDGSGWSEIDTGIGFMDHMLVLLAKPVRERLFGMSAIREGQKCMLRADMLATYYKHREEKTIRQYEYENYLYEYKAYKALRGNSFIDRIAQEIAGWEIVT